MSRTVIDLDDDMVAEAMRIYGTRTKAKAVRMAMEEAVKRRLRLELAESIKSGELDLSEIVEKTGPRNADGTLQRSSKGAA
ncbi:MULTISPECIES: type II toxin-antitoxin system VapB family antitoxin [unclassified Microbispora]|uniref:type II toxin-antitoxin system VapB family antitoxin n=1 Tax=unclassified Microbispora TaxID=2614687 RepID=UPI001475B941|nr:MULTISPECIES: type II toxin-antitoxin system VapB family antitoxin [unclassified Microbispora]